MTFLGLLRQRGPFKETAQDIKHVYEKDKNWVGGGVPVGGTLHAGHGFWESTMNPPQNAPRFYVLPVGKGIVTHPPALVDIGSGGKSGKNYLRQTIPGTVARPISAMTASDGVLFDASVGRPTGAPVSAQEIFYSATEFSSNDQTELYSATSFQNDEGTVTRTLPSTTGIGGILNDFASGPPSSTGNGQNLNDLVTSWQKTNANQFLPYDEDKDLERSEASTPSTMGNSVYGGDISTDEGRSIIARNLVKYLEKLNNPNDQFEMRDALNGSSNSASPGTGPSSFGYPSSSSSGSFLYQPKKLWKQPPTYPTTNINEAIDSVVDYPMSIDSSEHKMDTSHSSTGLANDGGNILTELPATSTEEAAQVGAKNTTDLIYLNKMVESWEIAYHNQNIAKSISNNEPIVTNQPRRAPEGQGTKRKGLAIGGKVAKMRKANEERPKRNAPRKFGLERNTGKGLSGSSGSG